MELDYLPSDKVYKDDARPKAKAPLAVLLAAFRGDGSGVAF
jgi:hypothetical protein